MQIFNIGALELIIILLIMFILLGPKEMITTAQRIGKWIRSAVRSPAWREIMGYSQEIRELPKKIMEDTGLEETLKEVKASTQAAAADVNVAVNESMQDIRKSTQEAASEMNKAVKESVEAARVPEAEHIRLETGTTETIAPPALTANTATAAVEEAAPAVVETAMPVPAPDTVDPVEQAAVEVAGSPVAGSPKKPRRKRAEVAAEQAAPEVQAAPEAQAAIGGPAFSAEPDGETAQPARRTRTRKSAEAKTQTEQAAPEIPSDLAVQGPIEIRSNLEIQLPPENGPETPAPKKRRAKRTAQVPEEKQDPE